MNESYISTQISVVKTDRKLVAFYDKLKIAPVANYAYCMQMESITKTTGRFAL